MRVVLPLPQPENSATSSSLSSPTNRTEQEEVAVVKKSVSAKESIQGGKSISSTKQKTLPPKRETKAYWKPEGIQTESYKSLEFATTSSSICSTSSSSTRNVSQEAHLESPNSLLHSYSSSSAATSSQRITSSFSSSSSTRKRKNPYRSSPNSSSTASNSNLETFSQLKTVAPNKILKMTQGPQERSSLVPSVYSRKKNRSSDHVEVNVSRIHLDNCEDAQHESYSSEQDKFKSNCRDELERYQAFQKVLKEKKLEMVEQEGDGNCLFRAVSLQVYGDSEMHGEVRKKCLDFMAKEREHFSQFIIDEPFEDYIQRKRIDGVHGNNPEIQAISELFNRPVEVFVPENGANPINIFHAEYKTSDAPIRLSYHDGNHYNAVIDPVCPTAGLGLGLPGLQPGLADKMQLKEAVEENLQIQEKHDFEKMKDESLQFQMKMAMMESKKYNPNDLYKQKAIALSDLEATDFELEQMVLANSLKTYQNTEKARKGSSNSKRRIKSNSSPLALPKSTSSTASASTFARTSQDIQPATKQRSIAASSNAASAAFASRAQDPHGGEEEYPQVVQELVMNGFELSKVLHAYDLVGNNFDDLLCFLMSAGR